MITSLRGIILQKRPPWLWLEVQGVGYELEMPLSSFYQMVDAGETLLVHTHLTIREDAHLLYGFMSVAERDTFRLLIRVNGIGGKVALACLSGLPAEKLGQAVAEGNVAQLTAIPGIGPKTAERLVVELRDKMGGISTLPTSKAVSGDPRQEAIAALLTLGYKPAQASQTIGNLGDGLSLEDLIRQALQQLSRH
ncbi:Holliday junction branch migration protein RuvA [Acidithiobacillus thiooxidans]|uniref:Holliday junction branch migration complex subunit RuvA n=1 Tax=Acidithiobacillus thiooxidans ATCC 19377 TaxID=637390 RepID=A0A543Q6V8_ACITH|nr:Holliday junction branch migration protein RuvA [Acidithiobacillus thiooxidans]MDR7928569.1 Holliday junction branch migration protein RuvA [Acidithiobacillus thiooxidans]MDX5933718.1 Holliday junction branch migration protein RuvA [Acidithiobacillus thiooxidans]TQN52066.1 Holliday junction ATP-dependent DNA helicase RuvA [Acidithiobacillus thiooxidans ATCC 19377]